MKEGDVLSIFPVHPPSPMGLPLKEQPIPPGTCQELLCMEVILLLSPSEGALALAETNESVLRDQVFLGSQRSWFSLLRGGKSGIIS